MTAIPILRFQLLVYRHGTRLVAGLVVASLAVGGLAGYTALNPEETTTTTETNVQTVAANVSHTAVVTNGGDVWTNGTQLRDRSLYFTDVSPSLGFHATTTVPADRSVSVDHRLVVEITATREGTAFFYNETVLAAEKQRVSNGTVSQTAELNVSRLRTRMRRLQDTFGGVSRVDVAVTYVVDYDTGTYQNTLVTSSALEFEGAGDAYWLSESLSASERHAQIRSTATQSVDTTAIIWLSALAILCLVAAVGIRIYGRKEIEPDALLRELHARQMSEWISDGELPMGLGKEHVRLKSLHDVVDIGIDNEKRVVHDQRMDLYAVVDGEVVYYYSERSSWHDLPRFSAADIHTPEFETEPPETEPTTENVDLSDRVFLDESTTTDATADTHTDQNNEDE